MSVTLDGQLQEALRLVDHLEGLCAKEGSRKQTAASLRNLLTSCARLARDEARRNDVERQTMQREMHDDLLLRKAHEVGVTQRFFSHLNNLDVAAFRDDAQATQAVASCYERAVAISEQNTVNMNELRPIPVAYALADGSALATRSNLHISQIAGDSRTRTARAVARRVVLREGATRAAACDRWRREWRKSGAAVVQNEQF